MDDSQRSNCVREPPTNLSHHVLPLQADRQATSVLITRMLVNNTSCALMLILVLFLLCGMVYFVLLKADFYAAEFAEALMSSKTPEREFRRWMIPSTAVLVLLLGVLSTQWEESFVDIVAYASTAVSPRIVIVYMAVFFLWMIHRTRVVVERNKQDMELAKDVPAEKPTMLSEDSKPEIYLTGDDQL